MPTADLIVIGASQGGQALALRAAQAGKRVLLFERDVAPDDAPPSAMIRLLLSRTRALAQMTILEHAGVDATWEVNFAKLLADVRDQTALCQPLVEHPNLTLIAKEARLAGRNIVTDGKERYEGKKIVISTGSCHALPTQVQGLHDTPYLTPASFFHLDQLPQRLAIVGAGRTGVQLAQAMATLGAQVHLIDRASNILPRLSPEHTQAITTSLENAGVTLHLGASVTAVSYRDHRHTIRCADETEIIADALLLATGSTPCTAALDGKAGGVKLDAQGHVVVSKQYESSCPGVYAMGSCIDSPWGMASSWEDHLRLWDVWQGGRRYPQDRPRLATMWTWPQMGVVGLSRDEAELAGYRLAKHHRPLTWDHHAADGLVELLVDEPSGKLLGAVLIAPDACEAAGTLSLLIAQGATWQEVNLTPAPEGSTLQQVQQLAKSIESLSEAALAVGPATADAA